MALRRFTLATLLLLSACRTKPEEPTSRAAAPASSAKAAPASAGAEEGEAMTTPISLEQATEGLPAGKTLTADIKTSLGTLSCELFADKAPITVANFVGLARGKRAFK